MLQDDLEKRLTAWGKNSPDPDFFQGDALSAVLSDCAEAADRLAAISAERDVAQFGFEQELRIKKELAHALRTAEASVATLRTNAVELDRLCLIIESAVRNADLRNYPPVRALITANRAALSGETT